MVCPLPIYHLECESVSAVVGFVAECDRQLEVAGRIRLHAQQDAVEGEERGPQAGSRDPHGFQGVDVHDVEAATPVHQHLGQSHVADDGADNEGVASLSGNADRVVVLVEDDGRGRTLQLTSDGAPCGADLIESYLLLAPGAVVLQPADDDEAQVHLGERLLH